MSLSWNDILTNRKDYPDDLKVNLNGQEVVLKELRDVTVPKGDMTKLTQQYAAEKQQLQQQAQQASAQLAKMLQAAGQPANGQVPQDDLSAYLEDPTFRPIAQRLQSALQKMEQLEQRTVQHERTWWANQHLQQIERLKQRDPNIDVDALLNTAAQLGTPNLELVYRHMTYDQATKKAMEDGIQKGIEQGKKEARVPVVPLQGRRTVSAPLSENQPKTFDEAEAAAMKDPEIHQLFAGQEG